MKKSDIRFIVIILGIACVALLVQHQMSKGKTACYVCIYEAGEQIDKIPLEENKIITLPKNEVEISDLQVRMSHAECPDEVCVKSGWKKRAGEMITCLPNQIVVIIEGVDEEGVDGVSQ